MDRKRRSECLRNVRTHEREAINHDPSSAVGYHNDGSPVHSRLGITFQELEYITSADGKSEMGSGSRVKKIGFGDLTSHDDQIRERRG